MGIENFRLHRMVIWSVLLCVVVVLVWILTSANPSQEDTTALVKTKEKIDYELDSGEEKLVKASESKRKTVSGIRPNVPAPIIENSLGLFGLNSDMGEPLSVIYADAEFNAESDGDSAWLAMSIRKQCDFFSGPSGEPGIEEDETMQFVIGECSEIGGSAIYENWQLVEFAARDGQAEAVIAQPSFPPPGNGRQGYGDFESLEEWQSVVTDRVRRIADRGNLDAMLKIAEIYAGKFPAETDYDLARRYLAELSQTSGLTSYQESLSTAILKGIERSGKFN